MSLFKMNNTDIRTTSCSGILFLTLNIFHNFFLVFQLLILNIHWLAGTEREIQHKMEVIYPKGNTPQLKLGLIN